MFSIKIIIYFAIFIAIIAMLLNFFSGLNTDIEFYLKEFDSKLHASNCAMIINSFYANTGGNLKNLNTKCYLKEKNVVAANSGGVEKTAFILNSSTIISQGKDSLNLEVKVKDHYEK